MPFSLLPSASLRTLLGAREVALIRQRRAEVAREADVPGDVAGVVAVELVEAVLEQLDRALVRADQRVRARQRCEGVGAVDGREADVDCALEVLGGFGMPVQLRGDLAEADLRADRPRCCRPRRAPRARARRTLPARLRARRRSSAGARRRRAAARARRRRGAPSRSRGTRARRRACARACGGPSRRGAGCLPRSSRCRRRRRRDRPARVERDRAPGGGGGVGPRLALLHASTRTRRIMPVFADGVNRQRVDNKRTPGSVSVARPRPPTPERGEVFLCVASSPGVPSLPC